MRNISTVQRPIPQRAVSSAEISSLLSFEKFLNSMAPESVASVNSAMARALAPLTPAALNSIAVNSLSASGVSAPPAKVRTRSLMVLAAFTANCCEMMEVTRVS